jgi:hypothetical protein
VAVESRYGRVVAKDCDCEHETNVRF